MPANDCAKGALLPWSALIVVGLVLLFAGGIPHFGKLPSEIIIERKNFS